MNRREFIERFWRYYLILENDFLNTIRYVDIDERNFNTFSVEFTKQYLAICSEIDVLCKEFSLIIDNTKKTNNIEEYAKIIIDKYIGFSAENINLINYKEIQLNPWSEWKVSPEYSSPKWWTYHNKVKHNRMKLDKEGNPYYKYANLENILNALAGLFLIELYLCREICRETRDSCTVPTPQSELFRKNNWERQIIVTGINSFIETV